MEKLVRDNTPKILKKEGKKPAIRTASDGEYWTALKSKLNEEVQKFLINPTEHVLVDIYEVMNAIYDFKGIDKKKLKQIRKEKAKERGKFKKRIILEE